MKLLTTNELHAGDVLLCYKNSKLDLVGKGITHVTNSEYTHAAICIDSCTTAESVISDAITKVKVQDLVKRYVYVGIYTE